MKSHAKLFSKFVNISKEQQHQQKTQSFATFLTKPRGPSADSDQQVQQIPPSSTTKQSTSLAADSVVMQPSIGHFRMLSPRDFAPSDSHRQQQQQKQPKTARPYALKPTAPVGTSGQRLQHFYEESVADPHEQPRELAESAAPTPADHGRKPTASARMTYEGAQGLPYSAKLEDSTDQLVRIEASPTNPVESRPGTKRKESKRRKRSGATRSIKVSPVKSQASPDRLA